MKIHSQKILIGVIILLLPQFIIAQHSNKKDSKARSTPKVSTNNNINKIDINEIEYYVSNNGQGATDPVYSEAIGFYYPKGTQKSAVYQDGIVWAG